MPQVAAFEIQTAFRLYALQLRTLSLDESTWSEQERRIRYAKRLSECCKKIQRRWRQRRDRGLYGTLRETIAAFQRSGDPYLLLRGVLSREKVLMDPAMQLHVRFRLGGPR